RVLNHFWRSWATRPSMSVLARGRRRPHGRCRLAVFGLVVLLLVVLLIEDGLHALLPAALHDRAVLRQEDRDGLAAHDVVFLPDPRVAEQHHALLEVVVLGASRGARAAVARDDAHGARRHGPQNAVAALTRVPTSVAASPLIAPMNSRTSPAHARRPSRSRHRWSCRTPCPGSRSHRVRASPARPSTSAARRRPSE